MRWVTRGCLRTAPTLRSIPGPTTLSLPCPGSRRAGAAQDHRVGSAAARSPGEPRLRLGVLPFLYKMETQVGLHDLISPNNVGSFQKHQDLSRYEFSESQSGPHPNRLPTPSLGLCGPFRYSPSAPRRPLVTP